MRAVLIALAVIFGLAAAQAADEADRTAIRAVIERQMDAFKRDDAAAAHALAAPGIRTMFPDPAAFLSMVRDGYKPVFRAKTVLFAEFRDDATPLQAVRLTDEEGDTWLAVYTLEKQPDGAWLIAGCVLVKQPSQRI